MPVFGAKTHTRVPSSEFFFWPDFDPGLFVISEGVKVSCFPLYSVFSCVVPRASRFTVIIHLKSPPSEEEAPQEECNFNLLFLMRLQVQ